jgi:hypothetical protein
MLNRKIARLACAACLGAVCAASQAEPQLPAELGLTQQKSPSKRWLRDADNDAERFRRIEINERGFSQAMVEVGLRYTQVVEAAQLGHHELATYYWEKIADAINAGLMRRPDRTRNAEGMFLDGPWKKTHAALQARDDDAISKALAEARDACMACHLAEGVGWINDARVFRDAAPLPR